MKYDHIVKINGRYYAAGEEVPDTAAEEIPPFFSDDDIEFEEKENGKRYTKTEINKLTTEELKNLAAEVGIENAFNASGVELKKILIEHFGL